MTTVATTLPAHEREPKDRQLVVDNTPRRGYYTGADLREVTINGATYFAEQYIGIGPLLVNTARGEVKALSGDLIVYFDNPDDEELPQFLHVIPFEIAEILGVILAPEPPVMLATETEAEFKVRQDEFKLRETEFKARQEERRKHRLARVEHHDSAQVPKSPIVSTPKPK